MHNVVCPVCSGGRVFTQRRLFRNLWMKCSRAYVCCIRHTPSLYYLVPCSGNHSTIMITGLMLYTGGNIAWSLEMITLLLPCRPMYSHLYSRLRSSPFQERVSSAPLWMLTWTVPKGPRASLPRLCGQQEGGKGKRRAGRTLMERESFFPPQRSVERSNLEQIWH